MDYKYIIDKAKSSTALSKEAREMIEHNVSSRTFCLMTDLSSFTEPRFLTSFRNTHGIASYKFVNLDYSTQPLKRDEPQPKRHAYAEMMSFVADHVVNDTTLSTRVAPMVALINSLSSKLRLKQTDVQAYKLDMRWDNNGDPKGTVFREMYALVNVKARTLYIISYKGDEYESLVTKVYVINFYDMYLIHAALELAVSLLLHDYFRVRTSRVLQSPSTSDNNNAELLLDLYNQEYANRKDGACDMYPDTSSDYFVQFSALVSTLIEPITDVRGKCATLNRICKQLPSTVTIRESYGEVGLFYMDDVIAAYDREITAQEYNSDDASESYRDSREQDEDIKNTYLDNEETED